MNLVSLKNPERDTDCTAPCAVEQYGYGLRIYLDDDTCAALGIREALKAGTQVTLQAKALVVSATESLENDGDDKGNDISLSLQLTDMAIEVGSVRKDAASMLYGN